MNMRIPRRKLQRRNKFVNKISHITSSSFKESDKLHYIYAKENGILTSKHLETIRILVNRRIKKIGGRFIFKIMPDTPITKKSTGVRMGKGKGSFKENIFYTKVDQVLFEFRNVPKDLFINLFKKIKYKLPIKIGLS